MNDPLFDFIQNINLTQDQLTILQKEYIHTQHPLQKLLVDLSFLETFN